MLLPKDPYILLSFLNARLRDQYADLEDLCASLDADEQSLRETLAGVDLSLRSRLSSVYTDHSKEV